MRAIWRLPAMGLISVLESVHIYASESRPAAAERLGRVIWGPWPVVTGGLLGLAAAAIDLATPSNALLSSVTLGGIGLALVIRWRIGRGLAQERPEIPAAEIERAFQAVAVPATAAIAAAAGAATLAEVWAGAGLAEGLHVLLACLGVLPVLVVALVFARMRFGALLQLVGLAWGLTVLTFFWRTAVAIFGGVGFSAVGFVLGRFGLTLPASIPDLSGLGLTALLYGTFASVAWVVGQDAFARRLAGEEIDAASEIWKVAAAALD